MYFPIFCFRYFFLTFSATKVMRQKYKEYKILLILFDYSLSRSVWFWYAFVFTIYMYNVLKKVKKRVFNIKLMLKLNRGKRQTDLDNWKFSRFHKFVVDLKQKKRQKLIWHTSRRYTVHTSSVTTFVKNLVFPQNWIKYFFQIKDVYERKK